MPLPTQLERLAQQLEKDGSRMLVVVGTGVSAGATSAPHASWLGLLKHAIWHLVATEVFTSKYGRELTEALDSAFSPFRLDTVLKLAEQIEIVFSHPNPSAFANWLDSAFRELKALPGKTQTLEVLRDLWQAGATLVTTNYDSLLSDITGAPPVTWEEHEAFLPVMNREQPGILHLHGHWQRPSSVVLGKSSYGRATKDELFRSAFKSLWMNRSWLYVGCGDGLDDPDLGTLLEWGEGWGEGSPRHYFLARTDTAAALSSRADKPSNLEIIAYSDHGKLPDILRSLLPSARCHPFTPVDRDFYLFRGPSSGLTVPFPSHEEYLRGEVPALAADAEVRARLEQHGWAFVLDVASVGKTTLALRMATSMHYRARPSFYLDLARDFDVGELTGVIRRLSRAECLLILDNVHHQPELGRQLWDEWRLDPHESKLLLIATRVERTLTTAPAQDLGFYEHHDINPAIEVRAELDDLINILGHLYRRVAGASAKPLAMPPASVLQSWHRDYGGALGAFCVAVLGRLHEFQRHRWDLPVEAASAWVREKWLKVLDPESLENALCLAVFGSQELELEVQKEALPHPGNIHTLLSLGLVSMRNYGLWGQYQRLSFREPGWGKLILAAQNSHVDEENILFKAAAKHPILALALASRLKLTKSVGGITRLWSYIAMNPSEFIRLIPETRLDYAINVIIAAKEAEQAPLATSLWEALERQPEKVAAPLSEARLDMIGSFLEAARRHGRETIPLWQALEREPEKLAARALEMPLDRIASFLEVAKRQGRDTAALWQALERQPENLAARVWEASLGDVGSFLELAKRQDRETTSLWELLEREPEKLAARVWETPLDKLGSFLVVANRQGRKTTPLWELLQREPEKLAARLWETPLDKIGSFLEVAKRQGRDTTALWEALELQPEKLAERAWETPLGYLGSFLEVAKRQGRDTTALWEALEQKPEKLVARAWEAPLGDVGSFLEVAKRQGRNTTALWELLEREPEKLAARAWETALGSVGSFLEVAKRQNRKITPLWEALERVPEKLAARAWETPLDEVGSFLETARRQGRETIPLWQALEQKPEKLAARAWEAPLDKVGSFLEMARRHGRETAPLWEALEREPQKLVARAWETPLEHIAGFQNVAQEQERNTSLIWDSLARDPVRLSAIGKATSALALAAFGRQAPSSLFEVALADIQSTHWDNLRLSEPFIGATWLAYACEKAGRSDLKSAILTKLLRRANPKDFPPQVGSFTNVAWLLKNIPEEARIFVPAFLDNICTSRWLGGQYTLAACSSLADGLSQLAFQPATMRELFQNRSLGIRLQKEFSRFTAASSQEQADLIRLLGSVYLCGWPVARMWVDSLSLDLVSALPNKVIPHRADAKKVERWQFQLWLGLRAVASIGDKVVAIPADLILQTLNLWRANLAETSDAASVEHRVNMNMVTWLERCIHEDKGLLPAAPLLRSRIATATQKL